LQLKETKIEFVIHTIQKLLGIPKLSDKYIDFAVAAACQLNTLCQPSRFGGRRTEKLQ
jgi:hypothetical protein